MKSFWKIFIRVLESLGKFLDFLSLKEWEPSLIISLIDKLINHRLCSSAALL